MAEKKGVRDYVTEPLMQVDAAVRGAANIIPTKPANRQWRAAPREKLSARQGRPHRTACLCSKKAALAKQWGPCKAPQTVNPVRVEPNRQWLSRTQEGEPPYLTVDTATFCLKTSSATGRAFHEIRDSPKQHSATNSSSITSHLTT